jgi:hypothetical protein
MNLIKRLLAASGAAGLLIGVAGVTQAVASGPPFTGQILLACANVGETQKITIEAAGDSLIHIEVAIAGNTANGGTQNGTGVTDANHNFKDEWTLASVSVTTTANVRVWALTADGVATGQGTFTIQPAAAPCASPAPTSINGNFVDVTQVGGSVKKTCDTGVSGTAVFSATIHINVRYDANLATTIALPADLGLSLACNGESQQLPLLPPTSTITLHESTLPTGAAAAAATTITIGTQALTATNNNAKAAVEATPTPTPAPTPTPSAIVLPATGHPAGTPGIPWPAFGLVGLVAIAGAGLVLRRRS